MKQRITLYTFLLSGFFLLLGTSQTKASHIMGGDITYNCIGPNTFVFTAQFYRDCNGIPLPNTINLTVYSPSGCGPSQTITLELIPSGPQIVTPLCPGEPDACSSGAGTYGIQQYTYTHVPPSQGNGVSSPPVVLSSSCTDWTVWWSSCCRNGAITTGPANDGFYLETLLNNADAPCNNSPNFLNTPTPYACIGETVNYSHGVSEWDGDSLVFSLIPCLEGTAPSPNSVAYVNPYSGTTPLSSSTGFTIDQQTGAITFTPNIQQVGVICVLVEEYRNGTKIGHVMRDMQFTVLPCSNSLPVASGANGTASSSGATGDYNIQVCEGEVIDFMVETFDSLGSGQTSGDNIDLSWNGGINNPNASFTVFNNNTDSSSARFRWPTTKNDAGFYIFTVNLQDDACPLFGVNIFTFSITINDVPDVDAGGYQIACNANDTLTLNAVANSLDLSYQWQTVTGAGTVSNATILTPDVPPTTGTYKLVKTYQSGCVDSNVVAIDLSPGLQMPVIPDANLCQGDSIQLDATINVTASPPTTFTNNTPVPFGQTADTAFSVITVSGIQPGIFDVNMLQSVCIDVSYPLTSFLSISLVSPNGTVINLSSNNGSGANYTGTCFVPTGTAGATAIDLPSNTNPYTGSYTPEGTFSSFTGDVVNGEWTLRVASSTALPGFPGIQLNSWNMTFLDITNTMSYAWTPATDLSCTTCPDPWASPTTPTVYQVITTDFYNCTDTQSVFVDIISALTAPVVTCSQVTTTSLTFAWGAITGATGYEVSIDNGATWVPANGNLQHQLTGLALGQSITILVRGISTCPGIPPNGTQTCTTTPCTLDASFVSSTDATCNSGSDGTAAVSAVGGTPSYTYQIGTQPVQTTGNFTGLAAGNYIASVTDVNGCIDTVQITINEPTAIVFTTDSTLTSCNGSADGTAIVIATGGTGTLTYQWDANAASQTTDTATALIAGTYNITITDANSCFTTGSVTVNEPPLIVLDSLTFDVSCNAAMDGSAQVLVQGGTGPFTYVWSANANGQVTDSIVGLSGGTYSVTVTDANGCTDNISMYIDEASAIVLTTSMTQATCNGFSDGSATVSATGGTGGYTYQWSASANSATTATASMIVTGTHFVTVTDAAGCTAVTSEAVTAPPSMTLTTISNSPSTSCSYNTDGTAVVTPSGGNGGYTYLWNQGSNPTDSAVIGLPAGTSYVTVTDILGCSDIDSVVIAGPPPVVANPTAIAISCNGAGDGSITLAPVGGTGALSFLWSNAATTQDIASLAAGTYVVTITDANMCMFVDSATIIEPDTLQTTATMTPVSCLGGNDGTASALPVGGQAPYTYSWSSSSTDSTATILVAGTYTLTVTDASGCTDTTSVIVTEPATAVTSTISATDLLCNGDGSGTATVVPSGGTVGAGYTYLWSDANAQTTATATGLPAGPITVTVTDGNGCTTTNTITLTEPVALGGTTTGLPASCFGVTDGAASIAPTGGTIPYAYAWSAPTITTDSFAINLAAGWHYVTVTDANSCTYVDSFEVIQPLAITTTTTVDSTLCNADSTGMGSVTAIGGNGGFTYAWSYGGITTASITGLPAGWHYVTVTDINGCSAVDSIEVLEPTPLTSSTTTVDANCFGAATGSATVTGAGGTLNYSYLWDGAAANQTTATASNLLAGTYSVTVTDLNGCTSVSTATVGEPATPVSSTTSGTDLLCNGDGSGTVTVVGAGGTPDPAIASGYSYLWSDANAQTTATATGLQAGTYFVTVTDLNGCNTLDSVTINEPTALIGVTSGTPASCFGAIDGTVVITPAGGTPGYTYSWSPSGSTDSLVTGLAAGMHYVTVTDANMCTYVDSFEILQPAMIMTATSVTPVACFGDSTGTASVTVTGGNGNETFMWSFGGVTSQSITGLPAGWHYVTVTDINGCSTTDSVQVTQPTLLTLSTTQVDVDCFGQATGSATVTPAGGTAGYTYLWNTVPQQVSATATNLPAGTYVVTVTDANGCSETISVTINQPPTGVTVSDITFTQVSCFGGSDGTATVTATGGAGNYTYAWNPTGQTTQTATGLTIGTYTVVVTDMNGCFTIDSITIDEPAPITTIFTNVVGSSCNGGNDGTATVAASGGVPNGTNGYTYVWNTIPQQNGATATGLNGGQTYTVVITDANGCTTNNSVTIPQPDAITLTTTQVNVNCFGFTDAEATVIPAGGTPGFTFQWDANAGNQTNATATGLGFGSYSVTVTDVLGCTATTGVTITQPAELVTNKSTVDVLCKGESTGEAQVLMSGGTGPYYINWESNLSDPPTDLAAGTYTYVVTDANGCQLTDSVTIEEPAEAVTAMHESTDVTCYEDRDGIINIYPEGGVGPYQFSLNGTTFDNNNSKVGLQAGDYTYYVRDDNGCIYTETVSIVEPDEFTVDLGPDVDITLGESVLLEVVPTNGSPNYTYTWAPAENLSCTDCGNPVVDSLQDDRYITVLVEDMRGCTAEDDIYIRIEKPRYVFIANAFTPNDDGNNDWLFVQGGNGTQRVTSFQIFDRWGELVYETLDAPLNDTSYGWDGTYKGQDLNGGVFVWVAEVEFEDGERLVYKGSTVLIR